SRVSVIKSGTQEAQEAQKCVAQFLCLVLLCSAPLLVGSGEDHAALGTGAAFDALTFFCRGITWDVPNRGLRLVFDFLLALARPAPMGPEKPTLAIENFIEFRVIVDAKAVLLAEIPRSFKHGTLDRREHLKDGFGQIILRRSRLFAIIAPSEHDLVLLQILWA